jgi:hypothetical protein
MIANPVDVWAQDCGCVTHTVPHWLHADALWRAANRRILDDLKAVAANAKTRTDYDRAIALRHAFATEDLARVREKLAAMRSRGIEQIPPEVAERAEREVAEAWRIFLPQRIEAGRRSLAALRRQLDDAVREHDGAEGTRRSKLADEVNRLTAEVTRVEGEFGAAQRLLADHGAAECTA